MYENGGKKGEGTEGRQPGNGAPRRPVGQSGNGAPRRPGGQPGNGAPRRPAGQPGNGAPRRPVGQPGNGAPRRPGGQPGNGAPRRPAGQPGNGAPGRPAGQPGNRPPRRPQNAGNRKAAAMSLEERRRREYMKLKKEREKRNKIVMLVCICLIAVLIISGVIWSIAKSLGSGKNKGTVTNTGTTPSVTLTGSAEQSGTEPKETPTPTPVPEPKRVTLVAVGDDLVHTGVYEAGRQSDGSHDYSCLFENIASYLSDADIKVMNQETIFGGDDKELSSYPNFNSPTAIGDALVDAGFNVVSHATNHALDMGLDGLLNSVEFWKTKHPDVLVLGIYENAEEQAEIPIMEVNGIKFAMLNYTYSHNWETLSTNAEGHLNMLCDYDPDSRAIDFNTINPQVLEDIKKAEGLADFTIVFPHWGTEYVMGTTTQQVTFAKQMTEAGADLIIGTHPHVIEPVEWVQADNGNKALCYYSLGNFTSTQDEIERILGGMAKLTIVQDETGIYIDEESIKAIPLVTHYVYPGWNGATVVESTYALKDYTDAQAAAHGLLNRKGVTVTRDKLVALAQDTFGEYYSLD